MIEPLTNKDVIGAPRSYWTKKRIMDVARLAGANEQSLAWLKGMSAKDIGLICLLPVGYCICGSSKDPAKRSKVMYWRVDIDLIKSLGGVML